MSYMDTGVTLWCGIHGNIGSWQDTILLYLRPEMTAVYDVNGDKE